MDAIIAIAVLIACVLICREQAERKGYNMDLWAVLGLLFGVFAVVVVLLLPKKEL